MVGGYAADHAGRREEWLLKTLWPPPTPPKREHRPRDRTAPLEIITKPDTAILNQSEASAQRAVPHAAKRVGRLQHQARLLTSIGQRDASVRLRCLAVAIAHEVLG
jgi:hypothetical protein